MSKYRVFTWTALLAGLVVLLGMTPLGLIPLGFINVTVLCVPVITGTLLLGLKPGLVLGAAFGGVSTLRLLTAPSTLAGTLLGASPVLAILMSVLPRLMIPVVAHLVYRALMRRPDSGISAIMAGVFGSLTNTLLYLGLMLLFYSMKGLDSRAVVTLILTTGAIAGGTEAFVAGLLVPALHYALQKVNRKG